MIGRGRVALRRLLRGRDGTGPAGDPLSGLSSPYADPGGIHLRFDATNKCNLRCVMCHFAFEEVQAEPSVQWSAELLDRVEKEVFPHTDNVCMSQGTEPLMWRHLPDLLGALRRSGIRHSEMITNGTLLTEELCQAIVRSGLTRIQISIDGACKETYESVRIGASFDGLIERIELLNETKRRAGSALPAIQFNFVLMQRNLEELSDLVRLAHRLGVEFLSLRHVVMFAGLDMEDESLTSSRERSNQLLQRGLELADRLGIRCVERPELFDLSRST